VVPNTYVCGSEKPTEARIRYGYYRIYVLLPRCGWVVNHRNFYHLYRKEDLKATRTI
jgi:hypothetical protein